MQSALLFDRKELPMMENFKAIMFDLDDTLLDRRKPLESFFQLIMEECYENAGTNEMLEKFKKHDNNGYSNKADVLNNLFDEFPPKHRVPTDEIYNFWDSNFPKYFTVCDKTLEVVNKIIAVKKTAIITNGRTQGQNLKIKSAGLDKIFETIIISEEAGASKPDPQIFKTALQKIGVSPEEALYMGDNLKNDIFGCQQVNIKGIWYNPHKLENTTDIKPYKEISDFSQLLPLTE
jgi:putative hydrolase of the HAD superfamily